MGVPPARNGWVIFFVENPVSFEMEDDWATPMTMETTTFGSPRPKRLLQGFLWMIKIEFPKLFGRRSSVLFNCKVPSCSILPQSWSRLNLHQFVKLDAFPAGKRPGGLMNVRFCQLQDGHFSVVFGAETYRLTQFMSCNLPEIAPM